MSAREAHRGCPVVVERGGATRIAWRLLEPIGSCLGLVTSARAVGPVLGATPGPRTRLPRILLCGAMAASGRPAETVDRVRFAGTESGWKALAGSGSIGLGTREPERPGSATRARAAMSTDPTTNLLGRTRP
jgi:hypothetical protein